MRIQRRNQKHRVVWLAICFIMLISSASWATNYYVSVSGSDSNPGTSPESPWRTISKVNGHSFSPGDNILFKRGDQWRQQLNVSRSGSSSGGAITYGAYGSGDNPILSGANAVSSFSNYSGNTWRASSANPRVVWFVDGATVAWGDRKSSLGGLVNEYDWYYSGGYLYVYAPGDPDSRYDSVEGGVRDYCIYGSSYDYITIENLEIRFTGYTAGGGRGGIQIGSGATNWYVQDCHIHHHGSISATDSEQRGNGIMVYNGSNSVFRRNIVTDCGRHNIFLYAPSGVSMSNVVVEHNLIADSSHCNMDIHGGGGSYDDIYIRYNRIYQTSSFPFISNLVYLSQGNNNTHIYGNLIYNSKDDGIQMSYAGRGPIFIYNNTFYNNKQRDIVSYVTSPGVYVKNNIFADSGRALSLKSSSNWYVDYNCYYNTSAGSPSGQDRNSLTSNPLFKNAGAADFSLLAGSACIDEGYGLGSVYDQMLNPGSAWPEAVVLADQDQAGAGWEIGAFVYDAEQLPPLPEPDTTPPAAPGRVTLSVVE